MASTVLPHGIIVPEKFSRDWYADLYHNWQELDNLLGGGTPKDGTLTIQKNGDTVGTFSANQSTDETINITVPDVNDGTLTIQQNSVTVDTFTANSSSDKTVNISVPTKTSDLSNDSGFITGVSWNDVSNKPTFATVATSGSYNDLSNKPTIPTVNDSTLTIQKNGTTIDTFTANSSTDKTVNIAVPTNTNELTNGAGFITADYAVPRSGGAVMTSSWLGTTFNDNALSIIGGTAWNKGGTIYLNGKDRNILAGAVCLRATNSASASEFQLFPNGTITHDFIDFNKSSTGSRITINGGTARNYGASISAYGSTQSEYPGRILFNAATSGSNSSIMWLQPDGTWTWSGTACQITSDQRLKQQITEIDDKLLDAWQDVDLVQFKYNDAVSEKGDKARLHTGFVVQQIDSACKKHGVDISQYGLYCHEEYPEETEEVEVEQADGTKTKEKKVIREASEHYSLRYTEALIVECKYLRRCVERLTARIEELEKGNNNK